MDMFWIGVASGAGATIVAGMLVRAALQASAERHYRAAYMATLMPEARERLVNFEARGATTWRQFRDLERARDGGQEGNGGL